MYWISAAAFIIGACGKSAQIPLYTLPDAMAGPTPVSALIHAATMVTAGIFMITRLNYLFDLAPDVQNIIAIIGAVTSLVAATIALVQTDIKKVLAYSTVSQLVDLALGLGAYEVAVFM
jgi:NADH-quinone oxidoreductase subunit L